MFPKAWRGLSTAAGRTGGEGWRRTKPWGPHQSCPEPREPDGIRRGNHTRSSRPSTPLPAHSPACPVCPAWGPQAGSGKAEPSLPCQAWLGVSVGHHGHIVATAHWISSLGAGRLSAPLVGGPDHSISLTAFPQDNGLWILTQRDNHLWNTIKIKAGALQPQSCNNQTDC